MDVVLPGSHRRTDADIALAAKDVLQWLTVLKPNSVKVMSEKGWITLTGEVQWKYQQVAAVVAVRHLKGVMGVFDQIRIQPESASKSIKVNIESALKRSILDKADKIIVEVDGADVTLSGVIDNWSERSLVKHSAWAAPGVRKVLDKMTLAF
jgi:osmotically-inducible protein OsmY